MPAASAAVVRTLVDSELAPGRHVVDWDGRTGAGNVVASGVYYYRLEFGGKRLVLKAIVLK
jgi:flagellar hook assembly protein FlgD